MIKHYLDELVEGSQRILLLQGPNGGFFYAFSRWLGDLGKTVFKLNFNAGDEFFYPLSTPNTFAYRATVEEFEDYLRQFCADNRIDNVVCFGDGRFYHRIAKRVCADLALSFWVFEEGYLRPHYVTLEKGGVNDFSAIEKNADVFRQLADQITEPGKIEALAAGHRADFVSILHYGLAYFFRRRYPNYRHHRILNVLHYIWYWAKFSGCRLLRLVADKWLAYRIRSGRFGRFTIVPLQVYNDSQMITHSDFESVEAFITEVLDSFRQHAPQDLKLVFKHHPKDAAKNYRAFFRDYLSAYPELNGRIFYCLNNIKLPKFLRYAESMVVVNSTSGISALYRNLPTKVLGRANYDFEELSDQQPLADFWQHPQKPNATVYKLFSNYLINRTQINGNFYSKVLLRYPYNG